MESIHSNKSLEGIGSSSYDLAPEIRMHYFTVNCDTFSCEEKVSAVVPVTSNMFRSNVSSMFLYFVGKVFNENTRKVSTRLNAWQYFRRMSI